MNPNRAKSHAQNNYLKDAHANFMGGEAYFSNDPLIRLHMTAASCFFGEKKYYDGSKLEKSPKISISHRQRVLESMSYECISDSLITNDIESAIQNALDKSVEDTLAYAVYLRTEGFVRTTPQVILAMAAHHKGAKETGLIRSYASKIATRLDDILTGMAYYIRKYGRPVPNGLRRGYADRLRKATEYELAKYNGESREFSLRDAIRLIRCTSPAIDKFMKGELKNTDTWESMRSAGVPWEKCVEKMGHMALLRNLRNLEQNKVLNQRILQKLVNGVPSGKQFPFRYYSAYKNVTTKQALEMLECCIEDSIAQLPVLKGRTLVLCDYSGSAQGATTSEYGSMRVCDIGGLLGAIIAKMSEQQSVVGIFGDRHMNTIVDRHTKALAKMDEFVCLGDCVGRSTENGIWTAIQEAIDNKIFYDRIVIFSDQQAGTGGLYGINSDTYRHARISGNYIDVAKLFRMYRSTVNPNAYMHSVQIAGYEDSIFPEHFPNVTMLSGWSPAIPVFIHAVENGSKVRELITKYKAGGEKDDN